MNALSDLFFPDCCLGCGRIARGGLCLRCLRSQKKVDNFKSINTAFAFDESIQTYAFVGLIRQAIHRFKYRGERSLGEVLSIPLTDELSARRQEEVITWIPSPRRKVIERGFDHAQLLAEIAAASVGLPCVSLIERTREAVPQVELDLEARKVNVRGLFRCRLPPPARVVVVDDVFTTGATVSDAARALKDAGCDWVQALAVARTP